MSTTVKARSDGQPYKAQDDKPLPEESYIVVHNNSSVPSNIALRLRCKYISLPLSGF